MKCVGLVDVDSTIPNLALMKLSAWHKAQGDEVSFYEPLFDKPDIVYASKVFDFTPDYPYFPTDCEVVRGGTGYDMHAKLPSAVESSYPDYDLYNCGFAMGRITRGCPRRCPWCCVWRMDGNLHQVAELSDFCRDQRDVRLLDDNILGDPELFSRLSEELSRKNKRVRFEALDIRFVDDQTAAALSLLTLHQGRLHFSWDGAHCDSTIEPGVKTLARHGLKPWRLTFYVLVGYNTTIDYDLFRIETLRSIGCDPFVMPYDKSDRYQRDLARWCNHKAIFNSVPFQKYKGGTGWPYEGYEPAIRSAKGES